MAALLIQQKHLHFSAGGYGNGHGHGFTSGRALCRVAFRVTFIVYHIEVKIANMTVDLRNKAVDRGAMWASPSTNSIELSHH